MSDKHFSDLLRGRTIRGVRRLDKAEMENMMWYKNPLVLMFTDGTQLILQSDDEGNDGGAALFFDGEADLLETIYTLFTLNAF